jgi:xylulose-5-phosphate/fructose-6-phosphate phosphoketolase
MTTQDLNPEPLTIAAIDAIDRVPALRVAGAHVKEKMKNQILECQRFAYSEGQDLPAFADWQWPQKRARQQ